ncbi:hypothetical protein LPW11_14635 [Geomonas sp. RF6]|uniref:RIFT barrel domain-containing protein n=1 Tax=Geomonas sp. RF6 TaxID=2897342 RepID=UPI001E65DF67|nr:hypothetical protein [Geomonas sp. RF6]UFS69128.1 hypothetical protein LPW11_14635 [Geomonas sp. RF6]
MKAKEIWVMERDGVARAGEPVRVSVPFARGEAPEESGVRLLGPDGKGCPVQLDVLSRWHDSSVKWLLCDFLASVPAAGKGVYRLVAGEAAPPPAPGISIVPGEGSWTVDTGVARFTVDARKLRPFAAVTARGARCLADSGGVCELILPDGARHPALVESAAPECGGPLRATLALAGRFDGIAKALFFCRLHFHADRSYVGIDFTLHNPCAATHPGGIWDLGDPGSLLFSELSLQLPFPPDWKPMLEVAAEPGEVVRIAGEKGADLSIRQESSGGRRCLSPNHRTAQGPSYASGRGYLLKNGERVLKEGDRATPSFWCGFGERGIGVVLPCFWQEFPKEISAGADLLKVSVFPAGSPALHELQGGEQKTTQIRVDFDCLPRELEWMNRPLLAVAAPEAVLDAAVLPDLPPPEGGDDLVDRYLSSPQELAEKREEIDEYGWRHYGEVYADHEAVYHQGEDPFISHYNNQYDLCAGLYRKFLATGEPGWGELAGDLARHVLDIDIYHTDGDREEYNGGLFWHTEHYISAGLATHRTFSREHLERKDPRFYGGGPAAEHCYTTGLLLHYWLTGDTRFRDAVVSLADWCYRSLSGVPSLLAVLKKTRSYLSLLHLRRGAPFPRYPLSRGTGNALNAALDAFRACGDRRFLARAEELIGGSIHPDDDVDARNLLQPEVAWSYSVLLNSVLKFLDLKMELEECDGGFAFARDALLTYARWMAKNEYTYLQRPERLEYPNETWAAQELRKSVVLYGAARHAQNEARDAFLAKARELADAAVVDLSRFSTSRCTRPLALMLQNGWVVPALSTVQLHDIAVAAHGRGEGAPIPRLGVASVSARVLSELAVALRETSLKRELSWLRARL